MSSPSSEWLTPIEEGQLAVDVFRRGAHLAIRGERTHEETIQREDWFHQECYWGSFSRSILLPEDVDETRIEANIRHGILEIQLPIRSSAHKIVVRTLEEDSPSR